MDRTADLLAEHVVDELVLIDARKPIEAIGHDLGPEVVATAGQVLDLNVGSRDRLLDPVL